MSKYRKNLPVLNGDLFLTDGGIETTLIFHEGFDLPEFAAFDLLRHQQGQEALRRYFQTYATLARANGVGFVLESPTWRASQAWGQKLGYSAEALASFNRQAIKLMEEVRQEFETDQSKMVISGNVGPRGDGYIVGEMMSAKEAEAYHAAQIDTFRETNVDLVTALTMNYAEEAIGITRAAQAAGLPVAISFTVETDGRLPSGQSLKEAIEQVDAATNNGPIYYMINCAHPTHFADVVAEGGAWLDRIGGLRANASTKSHAELDEADELDDGNPAELGLQYGRLRHTLCNLKVLGGCCGTDHRHISEIFKATTFQPAFQ
jgi:S-methylmethionine-dependent homocysteine/selenocysteine methylase